jgi:hypothetical protein
MIHEIWSAGEPLISLKLLRASKACFCFTHVTLRTGHVKAVPPSLADHRCCWQRYCSLWPPEELLSRDARWGLVKLILQLPPTLTNSPRFIYISVLCSCLVLTHGIKALVGSASNSRKRHGFLTTGSGSYPCQLCRLCWGHKESRLPSRVYLRHSFFRLPGLVLETVFSLISADVLLVCFIW